jgi:tetratricopeptide (TPR) repeat protein
MRLSCFTSVHGWRIFSRTIQGLILLSIFVSTFSQLSFARCPNGNCLINQEALKHKRLADEKLLFNQPEAAQREYEKALRYAPFWTMARFDLAIAYYRSGDLQQASLTLEKLLEFEPTEIEARYNLACLYLYQKQTDLAFQHFERANELVAENSPFFPLIQKGLEFVQKINSLEPQAQEVFFASLKKNDFSLS